METDIARELWLDKFKELYKGDNVKEISEVISKNFNYCFLPVFNVLDIKGENSVKWIIHNLKNDYGNIFIILQIIRKLMDDNKELKNYLIDNRLIDR